MLRDPARAAKNEAEAHRGAPGRGCAIACAAVAAATTAAGAPMGGEYPWPILLVTGNSAGQPAGRRPSEAWLGVEPILRGGGVHRVRTPVRGQGNVGPTVQPQLWGHPLVVPLLAPFQLSPAPCSLCSSPPLFHFRCSGGDQLMRGFCGAPRKVTDLIVSHVYCDCFPDSAMYPGSHLNLNLLSAELGSCVAVALPHCHSPGVLSAVSPLPKGVPSCPCSFLFLPGT